jgi:hypothetical protein
MDQAYHLPPSSSGVVGWWPAFAVIWLCGCTASPVGPHHSGVDEDLADLCQEDPIQVQTTVDSWYARAGPQELLGAGNYVDVRWSWDPTFLAMLTVGLDWNATLPVDRALNMSLAFRPPLDPHAGPSAQGPSPLRIEVGPLSGEIPRDHFRVYLSTYSDQSSPVAVSDTILSQPVTVTVEQVYHCSPTVHPEGIEPS